MASIIRATTTSGLQIAPDNSGSLQLQTNGTTTALTIDTSQNVGIGTASPDKKLKVEGSTLASATIEVGVTNTQSSTILNLVTTGTTYSYSGVGGSTSWYYGNKTVALGTDSANPIQFITNSSERMRIDSSGNVSIGVQTANARLELAKSSGVALRLNDLSTNYWEISNDSNLIFNRGGTERMRIDSNGNVLVGATSFSNGGKVSIAQDATVNEPFVINDTSGSASQVHAISFQKSGTEVGSVKNTNTTTSYITSSDYRLKENVAPMTGALDKVLQLKPVIYKWKVDGTDGQGFIAHELQEVVPDCVIGKKDEVETYTDEEGNEQTRIKPQGVDTSFLVATLTAAIQEQQTIINDLKARVETLEAK